MISTARATCVPAGKLPVTERAPLTESFELALQELGAAKPGHVKFQPFPNQYKPDEWLGVFSIKGPTLEGLRRDLCCVYNDVNRPPKVIVTTIFNEKPLQQLRLDNPEAASEFFELFKDKVKARENTHTAKLAKIAANLPKTLDSIGALERQGRSRTKSRGPIQEINKTYVGSLKDRDSTPIELHLQTYKYSNPDGSDRPVVRILGKIGDIDIIATRREKDGQNADALNITLGHTNKLGRLMTKDASDKVATAVIETLLAKALIRESAPPKE